MNLNGCPLNEGRGGSKYSGGGFSSLASMLNLNRNLTHLELAGTGFDDKAAAIFEKVLLVNPVLLKLDIYGNDDGIGKGGELYITFHSFFLCFKQYIFIEENTFLFCVYVFFSHPPLPHFFYSLYMFNITHSLIYVKC